MTIEHNSVEAILGHELQRQLDIRDYIVRTDIGRLRISTGAAYIPDLFVLPRPYERRKRSEEPRRLEIYDEPMPLVVEVWSPSTGDYDVEQKLREYQLRGDSEIWRVHPDDRTLTAWRRSPDGGYDETTYTAGNVQPVALPGVAIKLEKLFE